eukprot:GFUD01127731.1.p1 GENE.GFUD01127731.1~~GFUD01127731.1.p1  ORF type:complete len:176 (+),score=35.21 GFUD01127731.1:37-528(+)
MRLLCLTFAFSVCYGRPQNGFQSNQDSQFQNAPQFNPNQFRNSETQFNPNQFRNSNSNPLDDLSSGISGLANGARTTAFLVEEGGGAGVDILAQFGHLFDNVSSQSEGARTRTRGFSNTNGSQNGESGLTLEDIGNLLRGSANILDNNAPRLRGIANQAGLQG